MRPALLVAPTMLALIAVVLLVMGKSPAWYLTLIVAAGVLLFSYLADRAGRRGEREP